LRQLREAYADRTNWAAMLRRNRAKPDNPDTADTPDTPDNPDGQEIMSVAEVRFDAERAAEWDKSIPETGKQKPEILLISTAFNKWQRDAFILGGLELFDGSTGEPDPETLFEVQEFERDEIGRWLKAIGMTSVYQFSPHEPEPEPEPEPVPVPEPEPEPEPVPEPVPELELEPKPEPAVKVEFEFAAPLLIPPEIDKPLGTRERNGLLIVIAALCKDARYDYTKHASTARKIHDTVLNMEVSLGESTIEGYLKKIPTVLEDRNNR
jgi:hypothetical protein